jgi:hypothetical protein
VPKADIAAYSMTSSALRKAQALKPSMIKLGSRHAAMKNNAHETMTKDTLPRSPVISLWYLIDQILMQQFPKRLAARQLQGQTFEAIAPLR